MVMLSSTPGDEKTYKTLGGSWFPCGVTLCVWRFGRVLWVVLGIWKGFVGGLGVWGKFCGWVGGFVGGLGVFGCLVENA